MSEELYFIPIIAEALQLIFRGSFREDLAIRSQNVSGAVYDHTPSQAVSQLHYGTVVFLATTAKL